MFPENALLEINGKLYGITGQVNRFKRGSLYEYNIQTNKIKKKCFFTKRRGYVIQGELINVDNILYGLTLYGGRYDLSRIFSYDLLKRKFNIEYEFYPIKTGNSTLGSLSKVDDDFFFGMTYYGGKNGCGTIFRFDLKSKDVETMVDFK